MKITMFSPSTSADEFRAAMREFSQAELFVAQEARELPEKLPGAEILIASNRPYDAEAARLIRDHGHSLKWIAFTTSGIDKALMNGFPKGVTVTNLAGLRAFAVAEHALSLMLSLVRQTRATGRAFAARDWARDELSAGMDNLAGKHLVILGTGAIGQDIARKAKAFDMRVTGVSRSTAPLTHFDAIRPREEFEQTAGDADFLMVAALADGSTRRIVSRDIIAALPPRACIVNIARGSLIDEPALIEALCAKRIAGAALDVQETEPLPPEHPLWTLDNLILTPHVSGAGSRGTGATHASLFAENLRRWINGERLDKIVIEKTA